MSDPKYLGSFTLIIAHNLPKPLHDSLAKLLWSDPALPPLITVRSAGFLAELHIQLREHTIVDSHTEAAPSLRLDKPFPELLEHARSLDFENMNSTDHSHVPFVVILVRALDDWKNSVRLTRSLCVSPTDSSNPLARRQNTKNVYRASGLQKRDYRHEAQN